LIMAVKGLFSIPAFNFTVDEIRHLLLATVLVWLVEISFVLIQFQFPVFESAIILSLMFIPVYILHEIAHKFVAQYYGHEAHFNIVQEGAMLTAISIFLPVKLLAPGAVVIEGYINREKKAKISLAGPLANLATAGLLLTLAGLFHGVSYYSLILGILAKFSIDLAFFNMIPFVPFDGYSVYNWNKDLYYSIFGICIIAWLFNPLGLLGIPMRYWT